MQGSRPSFRTVALGSFLIIPFLAACGGVSSGGEPAGPDADALPACSLGTTMADIEAKLFHSAKCSVCHALTPSGMRPLYPTNLDLGSPDLAARMVDKPTESDPARGKCAGRVLVPKNDPLGGVFVDKVAEKPVCGDRMPQALPRLSADEVSCVKRWALLAAQSIP